MWKKNNSYTAKDEIQNHFTGYLLTAIRRKKKEYLKKYYIHMEHEIIVDETVYSTIEAEQGELKCFPIMHTLDNTSLCSALNQLNERELYILLERAVKEKPFDELASELNISYKGVASIYYRAIKKIRDRMKR